MDIKIEAPQHPSQGQMMDFYTKKLTKKYAVYDFIKAIDVKVTQNSTGEATVSLQCKPEKGTMIFAADTQQNENKALAEAIRKLNVQIEKYKEVHYHTNRS